MGETININGKTYEAYREENGEIYKLRMFDEEFKIWVELNLKTHQTDSSGRFLEMLSNEYISRILNSEK